MARSPKKLLFICSANLCRSPTFERWFKKNRPQYEVKSTGIWYAYYHNRDKAIAWAEKIYVMDLSHELWFRCNRPEVLDKLEVVGISDQYDPDEPVLIQLIEYWIEKKGL